MATIKKFEDLILWQRARELCKIVNNLSLKPMFSKDFTLKNQIRDAAGSVMDNTAEGFGRGGRLEFINFLTYAMGSAAEVQSQSYRALDYEYISQEEFQIVYNKADESGRLANGLIAHLKSSPIKGFKFKNR